MGVLKLESSFFKESEDEFDIFNYDINEDLINYRHYDDEIIKITKVPNQQKVILSLKNKKGKYSHEIIVIK